MTPEAQFRRTRDDVLFSTIRDALRQGAQAWDATARTAAGDGLEENVANALGIARAHRELADRYGGLISTVRAEVFTTEPVRVLLRTVFPTPTKTCAYGTLPAVSLPTLGALLSAIGQSHAGVQCAAVAAAALRAEDRPRLTEWLACRFHLGAMIDRTILETTLLRASLESDAEAGPSRSTPDERTS